MKRIARFGCIVMACTLAFACSKDEKKENKEDETNVVAEEPKEEAKKAETKKPKEDPELAALAKAVETEEDFEEQAQKEITLDNIEAEADKMEQELASAEESEEAPAAE